MANKLTEFETVLMHRDGLSKSEAKTQRKEAMEALNDILAEGGSYAEVEDMLLNDYGLEMDYIFDLM